MTEIDEQPAAPDSQTGDGLSDSLVLWFVIATLIVLVSIFCIAGAIVGKRRRKRKRAAAAAAARHMSLYQQSSVASVGSAISVGSAYSFESATSF